MNYDTDYHVKEINPHQDLGLWGQQSAINERIYGQQGLYEKYNTFYRIDFRPATIVQSRVNS